MTKDPIEFILNTRRNEKMGEFKRIFLEFRNQLQDRRRTSISRKRPENSVGKKKNEKTEQTIIERLKSGIHMSQKKIRFYKILIIFYLFLTLNEFHLFMVPNYIK